MSLSFIDSPFRTKAEYNAWLALPDDQQQSALHTATTSARADTVSGSVQSRFVNTFSWRSDTDEDEYDPRTFYRKLTLNADGKAAYGDGWDDGDEAWSRKTLHGTWENTHDNVILFQASQVTEKSKPGAGQESRSGIETKMVFKFEDGKMVRYFEKKNVMTRGGELDVSGGGWGGWEW